MKKINMFLIQFDIFDQFFAYFTCSLYDCHPLKYSHYLLILILFWYNTVNYVNQKCVSQNSLLFNMAFYLYLGRITSINANWPGSCHDSHVFRTSNLCQHMETQHQSKYTFTCQKYFFYVFIFIISSDLTRNLNTCISKF